MAGFLNTIPILQRPFDRIYVDHLGSFVITPRRNSYLIVVIDAFTKLERLSYKDYKNNQALKVLENYIYKYDVPERLISDRGTCYTENNLKVRGINHM